MAETTSSPIAADRAADRAAPQTMSARLRAPRPRLKWGRLLIYAILIFGALVAVLPFVWMVSWSLMSVGEVSTGQIIPRRVLWSNYEIAWTEARFAQFMWNSARISAITVTGLMLFCVPAAYAFARMRFFGRNVLFAVMLSTMMIPDIVTLIPNFLTVVWISRLSENLFGAGATWMNNWPALTIPFMASAFSIFLLRQFFAQIPEDLWDAARIDGAGHLRFLVSVIMPLSRAPLMTVLMFAFIGSWNALLWPLLVVTDDTWRPVAFGLTKFVQADAGEAFNLQMAASVIMIIPIVIVYFIAQKQFTEGIAATGSKG